MRDATRIFFTVTGSFAYRHVKTLKVIDSYWVSQDGTYKYYEVLMVDPSNDNVMRDYNVKDILARRRRERAEVAGRMINNNLSPPRGRFGGRGGGFPYRVGYQGGYPGAGPSSRYSSQSSSSSRNHFSASRSRDIRSSSSYSQRSSTKW